MDARTDERFRSDLKIHLDQGEGVLRDVSASGVYFVTHIDLKAGQIFKFTLEFSGPQIGMVSAHCEARVVRVEPQGSLKGVGAALEGIEFRRIGEHPAAE